MKQNSEELYQTMTQNSIEEDTKIVLQHIKKLANYINRSCSLKSETTAIITDTKLKNDKNIDNGEELGWVVGIWPIFHM